MKRKIVITGLCLFVLLSAGWVLRVAQQQTRKINTTPAPPLRVEPAKESDATGKTDAAAKAKCASDYDAWFASNADHAECVAYTTEVDCLTRFIAGNCDGHHEQAEGGALIGGVVGGIGGFLAGGIGGAVAGGAAGAAAGYAAGLVSPACCTTLKTELTFARSQKATHCAAAVNHPCPV